MIDIIVAAHDRPAWLTEELRSIRTAIRHSPVSVTVTVVDDASDGPRVRDVVQAFHYRYIRHETNTGVAQTLADGFAATSAPWYSFWGDDDIMLPDFFKRHWALTESFDVIAGSYQMIRANGHPFATRILPVGTLADLRANNVRVNDGALTRRSLTESVGLRPERERAMMLTLWLALASKGARFGVVDRPTWQYRRHDSNLSANGQRDARFAQLRREAVAEYA